MNYFENEYTMPILFGSCKKITDTADIIRENTKLEIHIFADKLSYLSRLKYKFHKIPQNNLDIALLSLRDFAIGLHEYFTPLLIFCEEQDSKFIAENKTMLEDLFVILTVSDVNKLFKKV